MLNVPSQIKELYKQDNIYKNIRIVFADSKHADICNNNIVMNSVNFTESFCSSSEFRLGKTEKSLFTADVYCAENILGYDIEVFNEIDCSSLSESVRNQYAVYKSDIQKYVYQIKYGSFRIESCKINPKTRIRKLVAYSKAYNHINMLSPAFYHEYFESLYVSNVTYKSIGYSYFTAFNVRTMKNVVVNGAEVSLSSTNYSYDLGGGYSLKVNCMAYFRPALSSDDYHQFDPNLYLNAVIDYDKKARETAYNEFVSYIEGNLPSSSVSKFNSLKTANFVKSLHIPRYTKAYQIGFKYGTDYFVSRNVYKMCEFIYGEGSDFVMFTHVRNMHGSNSDSNLRNKIYEDNVAYSNETLYIPTSLQIIRNGSAVKTTNYSYTSYKCYQATIPNYDFSYYEGNVKTEIKEPQITMDGEYRQVLDLVSPTTGATRTYNYYGFKNIDTASTDIVDVVNSYLELQGLITKISRDGVFDCINVSDVFEALYPQNSLYPDETLYPKELESTFDSSKYIECEYGEEVEKPYGAIILTELLYDMSGTPKTSTRDKVYTIYSDYNTNPEKYSLYDLRGNDIVKENGIYTNYVQLIIDRLSNTIKKVAYKPCTIVMKSLPYIESGDGLQVLTPDGGFQTFVNRRTIKGEQSLVDTIQVD